jgi:hypothetical protein
MECVCVVSVAADNRSMIELLAMCAIEKINRKGNVDCLLLAGSFRAIAEKEVHVEMTVRIEKLLKPCSPYRMWWRSPVETRGEKLVTVSNRLQEGCEGRVTQIGAAKRTE